MRPPPNSTEESIEQLYKSLQTQISSSSSILILGGGPVGIEFAGEVAEYYNGSTRDRQKKQVTLVHGAERFITENGYKPKLGESLKNQLEKLGVRLVFNEKVDAGERETGSLKDDEKEFKLSNGETLQGTLSFSLPLSYY